MSKIGKKPIAIPAGVTKGYERRLEITGVGYRAAVAGKNLQLALGYSHEVNFAIPDGIAIVTPKPTEIVVTGIDKQKVGQVAAEIRGVVRRSPTRARASVCWRVHLPQGRQEEVTGNRHG
jgi:ribosomal protein L6P/L9E